MDDAEAVNPVVSGVFEYHGVNNLFPPFEDVTGVDAEVDESKYQFGDCSLFCFENFKCALAIIVGIRDV